ncbi:hypothetical protein NDU88_002389 [Pleurodeles waltl]|uniref:Uncharacterized protein n=1 Tax=Pleurodeles waltl TaxID=8319 RepID=A0AAV7NDL4_PLEWA|nr:hypothetical protein NDU88_002389 [Pleurodeles waltl]
MLGAVTGARTVVLRELTRVEDSLGPKEKEAVVQTQHAQRLREARAEHAELLKRLRNVDYVKYREHTHSEGDKAGSLQVLDPQLRSQLLAVPGEFPRFSTS